MDTLSHIPPITSHLFERDPLLSDDTLLFRGEPPCATDIVGKQGYVMSDHLSRNDVVSVSLIVCFAMMMMVLRLTKRTINQRLTDFFIPSNKTVSEPVEKTSHSWLVSVFLFLTTSVLLSLLFYGYAQHNYNISLVTPHLSHFTFQFTPLTFQLLFLSIYLCIIMLYMLVKRGLYSFVHSVFFSRSQRAQWMTSYDMMQFVQSVLLFPLTLIVVYLDISVLNTAYCLLGLLLFVKILLLFKSYSTFFKKIYGVVHLFVYFCALEAVPLIVLWSILTQTTEYIAQY